MLKPPTRRTGGVLLDWSYLLTIAREQSLAEQAVYKQLVALSHGLGQDHCSIGQGELGKRCGIAARKTVVKALRGLIDKGHIASLTPDYMGGDNTHPTEYRVFTSDDILETAA